MSENYIPHLTNSSNELYHWRPKGSKNGVRRYQYTDGKLTPLGRIHYGIGDPRKALGNTIDSAKKYFNGREDQRMSSRYENAAKSVISRPRVQSTGKVGNAIRNGINAKDMTSRQANRYETLARSEIARKDGDNTLAKIRFANDKQSDANYINDVVNSENKRRADVLLKSPNSINSSREISQRANDRFTRKAMPTQKLITEANRLAEGSRNKAYEYGRNRREELQRQADVHRVLSSKAAKEQQTYNRLNSSIGNLGRQAREEAQRQADAHRVLSSKAAAANQRYQNSLAGKIDRLPATAKSISDNVGTAAKTMGENAMKSIQGVGKNIDQYLNKGDDFKNRVDFYANNYEKFSKMANDQKLSPAEREAAKKRADSAKAQLERYEKQFENTLAGQAENVRKGIDSAVKNLGERFNSASDYVKEASKEVTRQVSEFASKTYDDVAKAAEQGIEEAKGWLKKLLKK